MKKAIIFIILINFSLLLAAEDVSFDIATALILSNNNNQSLINNDNGFNYISNLENYSFPNSQKNDLLSITKLCNIYLSKLELSQYFINLKNDNLKQIEKNKLSQELNSAINTYSDDLSTANLSKIKNKQQDIDNLDSNFNLIKSIELSFSSFDQTQYLSILMNNNNPYIINNLLKQYDKDAFLLVSFDNISNLTKLKIEYLDKNERKIIYNKIVEDKLLINNEQDILSNLVKFFNNEFAVAKLENGSSSIIFEEILNTSKYKLDNTSIEKYDEVEIYNNDLKQIELNNNYIILKKGIHYFRLSSSKESLIKKVEITDSNNIIDLKLDKVIVPSINLISKVGLLTYKINGIELDKAISSNLINKEVPFYIEAEKEGFYPFTVLNNSELDNIEFNLKPLWQTSTQVIDKAQNDFYSSLLSYILFSFTTLTINNINEAMNNTELQPVIDVLYTSMIAYSSINIINKLISYINLATN